MRSNSGIATLLPFAGLLALLPTLGHAADLGFRYKDGACKNAQGDTGLNPSFIGTCGDLRGVGLQRLDFSGYDFSGAQLTGANLDKSIFTRANLTGANLDGAILAGAAFDGATIQSTSFKKANFRNAKFDSFVAKGSDFSGASFDGATMSFAQATDCGFADATFKGSVMDHVALVHATLDRADFTGADLSSTSLERSRVAGAVFTEAKMPDAVLRGLQGDTANFGRAILYRADLSQAVLKQANLIHARLENANLTGADLENSDLRSATFTDAKFAQTLLTGSKFNKVSAFPFSYDEAIQRGLVFISLLEAEGVMKNVSIDDLGEWKPCFKNTYAGTEKITDIQAACKGGRLLLGCRKTGTSILMVAGMAAFDEVFKETPKDASTVHESNGLQLYFNADGSMGFAGKGSKVDKKALGDDCDGDKATDDKLCWDTGMGAFDSGAGRCGADVTQRLDPNYERLIFVAD